MALTASPEPLNGAEFPQLRPKGGRMKTESARPQGAGGRVGVLKRENVQMQEWQSGDRVRVRSGVSENCRGGRPQVATAGNPPPGGMGMVKPVGEGHSPADERELGIIENIHPNSDHPYLVKLDYPVRTSLPPASQEYLYYASGELERV